MFYPEMDYFLNESLSDFVFVVNGQRIPANKQLLIIKSPVFRAMFSGNFCESKEAEESELPQIDIKDTTFDAFKTLIRFIYTDEFVLKDQYDWTHVSDVYQLSDRYEVLRLRQRVVKHLESRILVKYINDLIPITRLVFIHKIEELKQKLLALIMRKIHDLSRKRMNQLKEINDSTNDELLDELTNEFTSKHNDYGIHLKCEKCPKLYKINTKGTTFATIKTFIGLFYFDKLNIKVEEDFQRLREVCDMCNTFNKTRSLLTFIGIQLEKRITVENLESISGIAFDFKIDGLIGKVNEMKALFLKRCQ